MYSVAAALTPSCIWGIYVFGFRALAVLLVSIVCAVLTEYLLGRISKEMTICDGSALVTGILVGMNMSPTIPLFIPAIASVFAIAVVKWTFGGLGANWANPAIAGRVFVFFSFSSVMSSFKLPRTLEAVDMVSSATPLSLVKTVLSSWVKSLAIHSIDFQLVYELMKEAATLATLSLFISSSIKFINSEKTFDE